MDTTQFWELIDEARRQVGDVTDDQEVAERATALLATRPRADIVGAEKVLCELLVASYRAPLWAAAYVINGGCSDDGFDYFRGWLILQGREVFDRAVADPEALAELPVIREAAEDGMEMEAEGAWAIAANAHRAATGEELPDDAGVLDYPELDPAWNFDFDDEEEISRRLPRLAELYAED